MIRKPSKLYVILAVIILLVVLVPQHQANAGPFSLTGIASNAVEQMMMSLLNIVRGWVLQAIGFFANLLDMVIQYQTNNAVYNVGVVDESWTIIRNFVNLFFILVLIIMAFGTIFDLQNYTWKKMLPSFLIAALLINFSLAIGQYIITVANGLSGVFLKEIGAVSDRFAQGFSLVKLPTGGFSSALAGSFIILVDVIFSIIFLVGILLAFASAAIFTIARMFMLWFLLIISPIAWIGYTLPNKRAGTWKKWWDHFLCWCFFLPYFLFFVMFAVIFIGGKNQFPAFPVTGKISAAGLVGNDFLFYGLSLVFLFGGMFLAKQLACASGSWVGKTFGTIETGMRKYAPGAAYVRARYTGAKEGLTEYGKEIGEKGVYGFGGAQKARMAEARMKERFSFGAARGAAEKQLIEEINKLRGQYDKLTTPELRNLMVSGPKHQQLAAREILQDRGELELEEQLGTYQKYLEEGSLAAQKFAKAIDFARLSKEERERFYEKIADPEIKRKIASIMADKGDLRSAKEEDLVKYANLFVQEGDKKDFLDKAQKFAFEESIKAQVKFGFIKDGERVIDSPNEAIAQKVKKMKLDDILELSKDSLRKLVTENPEAARIIGARLNKETLASIPSKVDSDRMEILDDLLTKRKQELEIEETERQQKIASTQGEVQAKAMQPLVDVIKELHETIKKS